MKLSWRLFMFGNHDVDLRGGWNRDDNAARTTSKTVNTVATMKYQAGSFTRSLIKNSETASGRFETPSNFATIVEKVEFRRGPAAAGAHAAQCVPEFVGSCSRV
jgi:hypothetical protein